MPLRDRFRSAAHYVLGKTSAGMVYRLVVEISNACNLRCSMCPRANMRRPVRFMASETFEELIRTNRETLEFVGLNGYGEPLLHPQLFQLIDICRKYGVKSGISTNCTLLDRERADLLLASPPDQLTLAVDGVKASDYAKVRVGANFDQVMLNVRNFLQKRQTARRKPFVVLQCIYMTETKNVVSEFRQFFGDMAYDAIRIRQLTHTGRQRYDANYANSSGSCYWLWNEPMVLSDGRLVACCQDVNGDLTLGHITEQPLKEIWNNHRAQRLRQAHDRGKRLTIPLCRDCNMYQPSLAVGLGSTAFPVDRLNRIVPSLETYITRRRFR